MVRILENSLFMVVATASVATPALAGFVEPAVPAPVIGLGIPAIALFGLAYRRLSNRRSR